MKLFKRYCSVLLCLVLLSAVFSINVHAEEVEVQPYVILQTNHLYEGYGPYEALINALTIYPNNGIIESKEVAAQYKESGKNFTLYVSKNTKHISSYMLGFIGRKDILEADKSYKVKFNNVYHSLLFEYNGYQYYVRKPKVEKVWVIYADGTSDEVSDITIVSKEGVPYFDLSFNFVPEKTVKEIWYQVSSSLKDCIPPEIWTLSNGYPTFTSYFGEYNGDDAHQFSVEVESQESGLLKNLITWVKGIKSKLDDTFASISNGFSNVVSTITELPSKLWTAISEGLKNLFVPDEEYMTNYQYEWDYLLSSRLGAIYQVGTYVTDMYDSIIEADADNTIHIDKVSLDSVGIPFSMGPYDVVVVPEGFEFLADACKLVSSVAATFLVLQGLRRRYDEVMGVSS